MPNKSKKTESALKSQPKAQKGYLWLAVTSIVLLLGILFGGYLFVKDVNQIDYVDAKIGNEVFKLELANTDASRTKGLSERNSLGPNTGMLFDFTQDGNWLIWMKQMRFKIDIAWLNANKQVIYIKSNASPDNFPERYGTDKASRYVIEINAGEFERLGVKPGDYISF